MSARNLNQWRHNLQTARPSSRQVLHSGSLHPQPGHAQSRRNIVTVSEARPFTTITQTRSQDQIKMMAMSITRTAPSFSLTRPIAKYCLYPHHHIRSFSSTLPKCLGLSGKTNSSKTTTSTTTKESSLYPGTGGIQFLDQTEGLDFTQCKNPTQLEKSIASYLKSHPEATEQALVAMLFACAHLSRTASNPQRQQEQSRPSSFASSPRTQGSKKQHQQQTGQKTSPFDLRSNLLDTILQSSVFTSDQVFKIACSIHDKVARGLPFVTGGVHDDSGQASSTSSSSTRSPSLQVSNAFLNVCAMTGHFDKARSLLLDMGQRAQGDVKPDLTTYRLVLKTGAIHRRTLTSATEQQQHDQQVDEILDLATNALSRKARVAFLVKMGLGGLAGATVGKFTMLGVMALPSSGFFGSNNSIQDLPSGEHHPHHAPLAMDPSIPGEGILHLLATQEVALGVGLTVGMLTAGYVVLGSTRQQAPVAASAAISTARKQGGNVGGSHHGSPKLPRAKLFGLYFPDLATTKKDEIRDYLRQTMEF